MVPSVQPWVTTTTCCPCSHPDLLDPSSAPQGRLYPPILPSRLDRLSVIRQLCRPLCLAQPLIHAQLFQEMRLLLLPLFLFAPFSAFLPFMKKIERLKREEPSDQNCTWPKAVLIIALNQDEAILKSIRHRKSQCHERERERAIKPERNGNLQKPHRALHLLPRSSLITLSLSTCLILLLIWG